MIKFAEFTKGQEDAVLGFLHEVISDTFKSEGLDGELYDEIIDSEVEMQAKRLKESIADPSHTKIFLAFKGDNIVATGGYTKLGETVTNGLAYAKLHYENIGELGSFYVKPSHQKQGLGSQMLSHVLAKLPSSPYKLYGLSSGYVKGKAFWKKQFGEPNIIMPKYFEDSIDCHVWVRKI